MKCAFIYNPRSGKGKGAKCVNIVKAELEQVYDVVDVMPTFKAGDATTLADGGAEVYDTIVVAGGDGTLNEVINGIAGKAKRPKIGYIPCGTTNDFAHALKIPKNPQKAVKLITAGGTIKHDVFRAGKRYGIYVLAFGMCTGTSYKTKQKTKKIFGRLAYFGEGLKEFGGARSFKIQINGEGVDFDGNAILGIMANNKYVGGFKINKDNNYADGLVDLVLIKEKRKRVSLGSIFKIVRLFLRGKRSLKNGKHCEIITLSKAKISLPEDMPINVDGEHGISGSFEFEVLQEHVDIFAEG